MNTLTNIFFIVLIFFLFAIGVGFLLPSKLVIERIEYINAPMPVVYKQINNLKNWEKWSPWHKLDTTVDITYYGQLEGAGAAFKWESDNEHIGSGNCEIIVSNEYDSVLTLLNFDSKGMAITYYNFYQFGNSVELRWGFESELGMNPFSRYMGLMMEYVIGDNFEKGLNDIKQIAESSPEVGCKIVDLETKIYAYVNVECENGLITSELEKAYNDLKKYLVDNSIDVIGAPLCFYESYDVEYIRCKAALPVSGNIASLHSVNIDTLPGGRYATTSYNGVYDADHSGYRVLTSWMIDNEVQAKGMPFDEYISDSLERNAYKSKVTKIYYPL